MPNIEFYFPSTDLSALRKLPAVGLGGATQLSLAGIYTNCLLPYLPPGSLQPASGGTSPW